MMRSLKIVCVNEAPDYLQASFYGEFISMQGHEGERATSIHLDAVKATRLAQWLMEAAQKLEPPKPEDEDTEVI